MHIRQQHMIDHLQNVHRDALAVLQGGFDTGDILRAGCIVVVRLPAVRASPISAAAGMKPSSTPLSMRWPSCRASSAMVPRPAVRPRSPRQWKPGCSAIMCIRGQQFRGGDGIVAKGVENSLRNVGRLGKQGMKETNREIIDIMVGCK